MNLRSITTFALVAAAAACSEPPPAAGDADSSSETPDLASDLGMQADTRAEADSHRDAAADTSAADAPDALADSSTDADADLDSFVPGTHTHLVDGVLEVSTDLPARAEDCAERCDDLDQDGLVDAWEDAVLSAVRPRLVFDEAESLFGDPSAVVAHVARVAPIGRTPFAVQVYITILYSRDYGSCADLSAHNGDSERVVLRLTGAPQRLILERAYTAAHEGTITDHSQRFSDADLALLRYDESDGEPRWLVYPSQDKHATYGNVEICEATSPLPCFDEDCNPDGVDNTADFALDAAIVNAGEPDAPLVTDLSALGFPGEDAWADQAFCGGLDRNIGCPGSVARKLTENPFR